MTDVDTSAEVAALEGWLEAGYTTSFRTACLILGNRADAEEAVQEAYLRAWRFRDALPSGVDGRKWLFRVVVNTCNSKLRKEIPHRDRRASEEALDSMSSGRDAARDADVAHDVVARPRRPPGPPPRRRRPPLLRRPERARDRDGDRPAGGDRQVEAPRGATAARRPSVPPVHAEQDDAIERCEGTTMTSTFDEELVRRALHDAVRDVEPSRGAQARILDAALARHVDDGDDGGDEDDADVVEEIDAAPARHPRRRLLPLTAAAAALLVTAVALSLTTFGSPGPRAPLGSASSPRAATVPSTTIVSGAPGISTFSTSLGTLSAHQNAGFGAIQNGADVTEGEKTVNSSCLLQRWHGDGRNWPPRSSRSGRSR